VSLKFGRLNALLDGPQSESFALTSPISNLPKQIQQVTMASSGVPQNPTPQTVIQLVQKLSDADPDFRFMSLNDLLQVLANAKPDFLHHDYNVAARAVDSIVKTLDDQNGEVQNLAIKWCVCALFRLHLSC
jgi:cullin-associated NEDD8-dissociated protein 1